LAQLQELQEADLRDRPRACPQSPYKSPVKARIRRLAKSGCSSRVIASKVSNKDGVSITHTSVCKLLHSGRKPLQWLKVANKRVLGLANKAARIKFCFKWKARRSSTFDNWVFLDAKDLYCYKYSHGMLEFAWCDPGSKAPSNLGAKAVAPWVFRFYGAVGKNFKSKLYFVPPSPEPNTKQKRQPDSFRSPHFIEMMTQLHEEIKASTHGKRKGGYKLIMDHARQHFSKASKEAMGKLGVDVVQGYPPQSWDLNIIENVWGVLQNRMRGNNARTGDGWRKRIKEAWASISLATVNALHQGFQERLELVYEEDGDWCCHH